MAGKRIEQVDVHDRHHDHTARILDFDGTLLETIVAPEAGAVVDVITARVIAEGGSAGKIGVCRPRAVGGQPPT